jgi:hypothetical protein
MKKVKDATITVTFDFNYTEAINEIIEDEEGYLDTIDDVKDCIQDWVIEDIETSLPDGISKDSVKIKINGKVV